MGEGYDEIKRSAVQILTSTCQNKDMFIFSRPMSDTVYRITDKALEPFFILKKGKYDIKYEELGRFMTREMKTMKCLMWTRISSLPEYYLIDYKQESTSIAKSGARRNRRLSHVSGRKRPALSVVFGKGNNTPHRETVHKRENGNCPRSGRGIGRRYKRSNGRRQSGSTCSGASVILLLFFYQFKLPETKDIVIELGIQVMAVGNV